jgi:hypothetical protein
MALLLIYCFPRKSWPSIQIMPLKQRTAQWTAQNRPAGLEVQHPPVRVALAQGSTDVTLAVVLGAPRRISQIPQQVESATQPPRLTFHTPHNSNVL